MEEQLKLIQELRLEVNELNENCEKTKNDYNKVVKELDFTFNCIQDMNKDLEVFQIYFRNAKDDKIIKFMVPILIITMTSALIFFNFFINLPLYNIILCEICIMLSSIIPLGLSVTVFDSIIEKHLVKNYPNIKILYDRITSLDNERNLKEQKFMNMKKDRDNLKITLKLLEEQLIRKREELDSVEEEYFDSLVGKTFTTEDGNHYTVGIASRGKTKVRIPDSKKNLGN